MRRVGDNQLLDIDNIGDEQDVDEEKSQNSDIPRLFDSGMIRRFINLLTLSIDGEDSPLRVW